MEGELRETRENTALQPGVKADGETESVRAAV